MTETVGQIQYINDLNVSDKWKRRFKLYERLNASELSRNEFVKTDTFKQLSWREKYRISSNFWAFIGGFIYYFIKRMHYKGAMILSLTLLFSSLLMSIDFFAGVAIPDNVYWIIPGVMCSMSANLDFYRKKMSDELMWQSWPRYFQDKKIVITIVIISFTIYLGMIIYITNHELYTQNALKSTDIVRINCPVNNIYATQKEINILGEQSICRLLNKF